MNITERMIMIENVKSQFQQFLPVLENLFKKYVPVSRKSLFSNYSNIYRFFAVLPKTTRMSVDTMAWQSLDI